MRPNPEETADSVTFTEEIIDGKLHILYSVWELHLISWCGNFVEMHSWKL